jgi:hypothetical protein
MIQLQALALRAKQAKKWKWMPAMRWIENRDIGDVFGRVADLRPRDGSDVRPVALPDLEDPATMGCLLALVRQAWRCPTVYVRQSGTRRASDGILAWEVCDLWFDAEACKALGVDREGSVGSWGHASEVEALVFALENAP